MRERIIGAVKNIRSALLDESKRIKLQFILVYNVLAVVSLFMTAVNVFTGKYMLMCATAVFSGLCILNVALARRGGGPLRVSEWLFSIELIALLTFFIVSGSPEGFSAIWACMLPASGLLLFRRKRGSALCAAMFLIMVFFFYTPVGESFLRYGYTDSFKLRFPMLYVAFFAVSFLLESVRAITFEEMTKAQERYEYLYSHDALTGLYNRYGFNDRLRELLNAPGDGPAALLILDIDYFKRVNDEHGHLFGDTVLQKCAELFKTKAGPDADVCRWGGEEFAILFEKGDDALRCGREILGVMHEKSITARCGPIKITASIGVAIADARSRLSLEDFVRTADACLYSAKNKGRDTIIYTKIDGQKNGCDNFTLVEEELRI